MIDGVTLGVRAPGDVVSVADAEELLTIFKNVGTILAWLGVAFRFLSLARQADAQTMGGIYDVPPIFLSARFRAACCPNITAKSPHPV